eukprot:CAMPEP_0172550086 /NCGR_PEP_ID=MMETSP1067-20121228/25361_1 /TAXON_ID=265564 ORGANISM="Thalassiosira punctigera, Strain Tpunct2005C2" /NCGR_SAMPLE_ID=MMETSP1067 /ASSEMBLY_ACC=CAM_ASM_000444 /LENGTH=202 /DNA_ID=CAMNT_0013337557 /DNA_START=110 /DNA_END=718 /DNA_ORIENTATION=-
MKLAILATLAVSAAAFAPAPAGRQSTAASLDISGELGAQMPLGAFDPLKIMEDADQSKFDTWREIEIKHGRVAMLAVTGYLTTYAGVRFPGAEDVPAGFAAVNWLCTTKDGLFILPQMMLFFIIAEIVNRDAGEVTGVTPAFPGDYRNGKLDFGWDKFDEKTKMRKRAIELNNGRAAQMGILGLMVHESMGNVAAILPLANN